MIRDLKANLERGKKAFSKTNSLAEDIISNVPPQELTEQKCIDYAKSVGLSRIEGQRAWTEIYREMKTLQNGVGYSIEDIFTSSNGMLQGKIKITATGKVVPIPGTHAGAKELDAAAQRTYERNAG